nr:orf13a [Agrobacterium sp.] [Nicotiana noctiflora]WML69208.1 ORF13a [Agrobacterium sp.] [Nicotiana noctiflora]
MANRRAVVRVTDGREGMLIVLKISVTPFKQGAFAVCRRANLRFHFAGLQTVLYRCSETAPLAMLNEIYSKQPNARYKHPRCVHSDSDLRAKSPYSSPRREFVLNT